MTEPGGQVRVRIGCALYTYERSEIFYTAETVRKAKGAALDAFDCAGKVKGQWTKKDGSLTSYARVRTEQVRRDLDSLV
jgi:hypothetical protein